MKSLIIYHRNKCKMISSYQVQSLSYYCPEQKYFNTFNLYDGQDLNEKTLEIKIDEFSDFTVRFCSKND